MFVRLHDLKHSRTRGALDVEAFLSHLASEHHVAGVCAESGEPAPLFLYKLVLQVDQLWQNDVFAAHRPRRLRLVLTRAEVRALLAALNGQG